MHEPEHSNYEILSDHYLRKILVFRSTCSNVFIIRLLDLPGALSKRLGQDKCLRCSTPSETRSISLPELNLSCIHTIKTEWVKGSLFFPQKRGKPTWITIITTTHADCPRALIIISMNFKRNSYTGSCVWH